VEPHEETRVKRPKPSELELQVLSVLWDRGPSSVHEIRSHLQDGKRRAYTTVLSVLQGLERKKLVDHRPRGQRNVYRAAVRRERVLQPMLRRLVRNVFAGRPEQIMQMLLGGRDVDADQLRAIRRVVDRAEARKKQGHRT
jgi:predicted transcriptional regulator